jgi:hypothetical protein
MYSLEIRSAVLEPQNLHDSLLNSLLAGNLGRERLAPDCPLRHPVCVAEKLGCTLVRIARNRRNSAHLSVKPDRRKTHAKLRRQAMERFSLESARAVRFRRVHRAKARRSSFINTIPCLILRATPDGAFRFHQSAVAGIHRTQDGPNGFQSSRRVPLLSAQDTR